MKIQARWIILGLVLINIGMLMIGFSWGYKYKKCPEHKCPALVSKTDTIIYHDTVSKYIPRKQFVLTTDTVHDTIDNKKVSYEENCLTYEDSLDGTHAEVTICSKEFPKYKPLDLHGSMLFSVKSDTLRTLRYIDTIRMKEPRFWKDVKIGGISFCIGAAACAGAILYLGR